MLESPFNKVEGLKDYNFIKNKLQHGYFFAREYCDIFKKTYFCRPPLVAASIISSTGIRILKWWRS